MDPKISRGARKLARTHQLLKKILFFVRKKTINSYKKTVLKKKTFFLQKRTVLKNKKQNQIRFEKKNNQLLKKNLFLITFAFTITNLSSLCLF